MTQASPTLSTGPAGQTVSTRIVSIDIFRGLTMAVMIFVNDLASVHGLSKWTYHMPASVNAMTYVDMVFPAFLFIVGMALPLAVRQRLRRNPSMSSLWLHIVLRSLALLVLGLILANADRANAARMPMSGNAWALLGLLGGVLLWSTWSALPVVAARALRFAGAALLVFVYAVFRGQGLHSWIDFGYPEILGLIGLTYFAVCVLYIPTRRVLWAPAAWFVVLVAYNAACVAHWLPLDHVSMYVWPWGSGAMASITMAGVVASVLFLEQQRWPRPAQKLAAAVGLGVLALAAGLALRPLGISKIRATPTWCLWSVGASFLLFALLYWLCDIKRRTSWAWLVRAAGANTLLTYLLPDFYYFLSAWLGFEALLGHWNHGWPGVLRAACFTIGILLLAQLFTRLRLRMQL